MAAKKDATATETEESLDAIAPRLQALRANDFWSIHGQARALLSFVSEPRNDAGCRESRDAHGR